MPPPLSELAFRLDSRGSLWRYRGARIPGTAASADARPSVWRRGADCISGSHCGGCGLLSAPQDASRPRFHSARTATVRQFLAGLAFVEERDRPPYEHTIPHRPRMVPRPRQPVAGRRSMPWVPARRVARDARVNAKPEMQVRVHPWLRGAFGMMLVIIDLTSIWRNRVRFAGTGRARGWRLKDGGTRRAVRRVGKSCCGFEGAPGYALS